MCVPSIEVQTVMGIVGPFAVMHLLHPTCGLCAVYSATRCYHYSLLVDVSRRGLAYMAVLTAVKVCLSSCWFVFIPFATGLFCVGFGVGTHA